ncbi:MAG: AraC family transcriptional regulator [Cytophagaceae bacterium]|nr:MAG: AraC family transcriptional regulator [Cytophagaceae bacterium]
MRFLFPLVLLFTALGLGIYAYLGGLRTPTVALETSAAPVLLAGQPYAGKVDNQRFGELYREAKTMQENGRLGAARALANLYYNDPEAAHDSIRAFVGLAVADTARPLPAGWHYRVVPAGRRALHARVAGVSFLLAPGKLYAAAEQALKTQQLTKQPPYLEQFGAADESSELWLTVK